MIADVLVKVQKTFLNDWVGEVHIGSEQFKPTGTSWVHLDVEPIFTESLSYQGGVAEEHFIYVTCYHTNQVQAAKLADRVIDFIQNKQLDEMFTRAWRPVNQGMIENGKAFYKLSIPIEIIN